MSRPEMPPIPTPVPQSRESIEHRRRRSFVRSIGLGLITGAADDDPSAIGTYAAAGAMLGFSFLWTTPVMFPMMVAVVYLSSKLGLVTGEGLFAVIRLNYPRWFLYAVLAGVIVGNLIEAAADMGAIGAALNLLIPLPIGALVAITGAVILILQVWGSYTVLRNIFRVLAMALLAYVGAALLARPNPHEVLHGTLFPDFHFTKDSIRMLVAIIGTSLSAYLYTWQSNEEVEEKIAAGKRRLWQRRGTSRTRLKQSMWDIIFGMLFSSAVMYFIILSTAATLHKAGKHDISTAAEAAQALQPLAGHAAALLFTVGIVGVGFLSVPVMTTGAAYDLCQSFGWKHGLSRKPAEAKLFYISVAAFTALAVAMNFLGFNPMKALVFAGIVQGFSTPPLLLLILIMTNSRKLMGNRVNGMAINILGGITCLVIFGASIALLVT